MSESDLGAVDGEGTAEPLPDAIRHNGQRKHYIWEFGAVSGRNICFICIIGGLGVSLPPFLLCNDIFVKEWELLTTM